MPEQHTINVSTEGQVILLKAIRRALRWEAGTRLVVENRPEGVLLKPEPPFVETRPHTYSDASPGTVHRSRYRTCRPAFRPKPSGAMRAIDTDVLERYLTGDEPEQAAKARTAVETGDILRCPFWDLCHCR